MDKRILKPGGLAVLPVPVLAEKTIKYSRLHPTEAYHVRVPGTDYLNRYAECFSNVDIADSSEIDKRYQVWIHEDRKSLPSEIMPNRTLMFGERYLDYVPICYK